jgi:hypothetical protein
MSVPEFARFLGVSPDTALGIVERGEVASVPVGRRKRIDPIDAAVFVLAGREGVSFAEFWKVHGEATEERARRYIRSREAA